jgi:hypothetical protein
MTVEIVGVHARWIAVYDIGDLRWDKAPINSFTRPQLHRAIFKDFDTNPHEAVVPHRLRPTRAFHDIIQKALGAAGTTDTTDSVEQEEGLQLASNWILLAPKWTLDLYPAGLLVIQIEGSLHYLDDDALLENLRFIRRLTHPKLREFCEKLVSLATGSRETHRLNPLRDAFLFDVEARIDVDRSWDWLSQHRALLVGALVGAPAAAISERLVAAVEESCAQLNVKASNEVLYLNGQGGIRFSNIDDKQPTPYRDRMARIANLWEIALFVYGLLTERSSELPRSPLSLTYIADRVTRWVTIPSIFLPTGMANQLNWKVITSGLGLEGLLQSWSQFSANCVSAQDLQTLLAAGSDRWEVKGFPDTLDLDRSADPIRLDFVSNSELADLIVLDIREAQRSLATGNYRAAAVFAGAAMEGMLLALAAAPSPVPQGSPLLSGGLQDYIRIVCPDAFTAPKGASRTGRNMISSGCGVLLDQVCRPWRNFIHAGRFLAADTSVSRAEATLSVTAIELLLVEGNRAAARGYVNDQK